MMTPDPWDCSVGVDIEEVDRIRAVVRRWGDRFLKRHFTDQEIAYCRSQGAPGRVAGRALRGQGSVREGLSRAAAFWGGTTSR